MWSSYPAETGLIIVLALLARRKMREPEKGREKEAERERERT